MATTANISFRDDDMDIYQWVEEQWKDGIYRNRSHVLVECARKEMKRQGDDEVIT